MKPNRSTFIVPLILCVGLLLFHSVSWGQMQPIRTISFPNQFDAPPIVAISPDGNSIFAGRARKAAIFNANTGEVILTFGEDNVDFGRDGSEPRAFDGFAVFSPDGKTIFTGESTFSGSMWNPITGERIFTITTPSFEHPELAGTLTIGGINGVDFTPDGRQILTGDLNGFERGHALQLWDAKTGKEIRKIPFQGAVEGLIKISPDGKSAWVQANTNAFLIELESGNVIKQFPTGNPSSTSVSFKSSIALVSKFSVRLFNLQSSENIKVFAFPISDNTFRVGALSPDGRLAVLGGSLPFSSTDTLPLNAVLSPRVVVTTDSQVSNPMDVLRTYPISSRAAKDAPDSGDSSVRFFPDGKHFLTVNGTNIHIWDISDLTTGISNAAVYDN